MVSDVLTVLSFSVLCMIKLFPVIPQVGRCVQSKISLATVLKKNCSEAF